MTAQWRGSEGYEGCYANAFFTVRDPSATLPSKLELSYRSNLSATLTVERWLKNWVKVRNAGPEKLSLTYNVVVKCREGWVDISPFPQPFNLYLDPGENQTIWYFIDLTYRSCEARYLTEGEAPVTALVYIEDSNRPGDYVAVFIHHAIKIVPTEKLESNFVVQGCVKDPEGRPIPNARVELWGAYGVPQLFTGVDANGFFKLEAYAAKYSDTGEPHGYCLKVMADGYQGVSKAFFPKLGDVIEFEFTLKPLEEEADYKLVVKTETSGYPIWEAAMSEDEEYIVFANGHHSYENPDPSRHGIYFLATNGTILWRYLTTDQVWGIDMSRDGRYVAAAFLHEGVARLFDREGRVLWTFPCGEAREVRINHRGDRVAIGTTFNGLILVDLESGEELWRTFLEGQVRWTCFTQDDSVIYAGSGDGYLYKVDAATGTILGRAYVEAWPYRYGLALSDDEEYIATASKIGRACLVRTSDMKVLWSFDTRGGCHWIDIAPNNAYLLIGGGGSYGRMLVYFNGSIAWIGPVSASGVALDERHVAVAESSIDIMTVDGAVLWSSGPLDAGVVFLKFSKDRSRIYAATDKATFYVFEGGFKKVEEHKEAEGGGRFEEGREGRPFFERPPVDLNGDWVVDEGDVEALGACYGLKRGDPGFKGEADLDGDGDIDVVDLAILASYLPVRAKVGGGGLPWTSDIAPGSGPGTPPFGLSTSIDGPWYHRILIALSSDAVTWTKTYVVLADQASVPDAILDEEGYVRVYYVDYFNMGPSVAISKDLSTWVYLRLKGLSPEWVDPSVVRLPDGRYRLYASYMPLQGPQDKIVSAISEDGVNFVVEEGVRYQEEGSTLVDPDVIYVDGRWLMYLVRMSSEDSKLLVLESSDGLSFTKIAELELQGETPCLVRYGEGYRLYVHLHDLTIASCYSNDCLNWGELEVVLRRGPPGSPDGWGVVNAAVVELPSGGYAMFYESWVKPPAFVKEATSPVEGSVEESLYRFGIGAKAEAAVEAQLAVELGATWIRPHPGPFVWGKIEQVKGQYDFSEADKVVEAAQERGVHILATIWPFADWDQDYWRQQPGWRPSKGFEDCLPTSRYKPHDVEAYKAFVKALVERYDGDGVDDMPGLKYPIKYWEVLNEPETGVKSDENFFRGTGLDYVEVLKATYEAIKEADPEAKVLIAAPAHPSELSGPFWSEVLPYVEGYFDYGNLHFNAGKGEDLSTGFKEYREALARYGVDVKIWGTEVLPAPTHLSLEKQAELWVKGSVKAFAEGAAAIKYPYVFEEDGELLQAFKVMASLLKGFKDVEKLSEGCYRFEVGGSSVYVAWGSGGLPSEASGEVYVVDMYGNVERRDSSTIQLSDRPIYVFKGEEIRARLPP